MHPKFDSVVARLVWKIKQSQTPVPGFILGLSGTDSIIAFAVLQAACKQAGLENRVLGVHYVNPARPFAAWFETAIVPWLRSLYGRDSVEVVAPLGGNQDPQRWADLHLRALNVISFDPDGEVHLQQRAPEQSYWVAGCINASEHRLGNHTILANAVSIQPIRSLWKSDVLEICADLGVPDQAIERARIPDCFCGRDELAAQNIELIDEILTNRIDPTKHDPALLATLFTYVREQSALNGFRQRIPYVI